MTKVIDFNKEKRKADSSKQLKEIMDLVVKSRAKIEQNPWPYISTLEAQGLMMLTLLADIEKAAFDSTIKEEERIGLIRELLSRVAYF